jgi:ribonuclease HII
LKTNLDRSLWNRSALFCGVDEAGRGALAGPVVAAAVVLEPHTEIPGARDSKLLGPGRRAVLDAEIRRRARAWAVGCCNHRFIDRDNILQATFRAMRLAVSRLAVRPERALVDGCAAPALELPCECIVGGDNRSLSIACASIVAKVFRDRLMARFDERLPGYGFARHKGYGTPGHLAALRRLGPSPIHRRTFAPVRAVLGMSNDGCGMSSAGQPCLRAR